MQDLFGAGDVGAALPGVVLWQRSELEPRARANEGDDKPGQLRDGYFDGVAEVDRSVDVALDIHQTREAVDQIVDIAERSRLRPRAIDGDRLVLQCLDDETGNDAPVLRVHVRAVGIEDARDPYGEPVLALVIVEQRLGAAFAFVVTSARACQINVTAVLLSLRMDVGIAVYLAGGRLQNAHTQALGETQHVDRSNDARLRRFNRIMLIVDRRGRASEVVDLVDLDIERKGHVVAHDIESGLPEQWVDAAARSCEIV